VLHDGILCNPSKVKVKVTRPSKLEILSFSVSSAVYNSSLQWLRFVSRGTMSKFDRNGFLVFSLVFLRHVTVNFTSIRNVERSVQRS